MIQRNGIPLIVQIVGFKKSGKTTLVCRLIDRWSAAGMITATVKHDAHHFEPDVPDTDSWKHRQAGATMTALVSSSRTAFFEERGIELAEAIERMKGADIILIEGWKQAMYPKLVLIHSEQDIHLLHELENVVAIVTWNTALVPWLQRSSSLPVIAYDALDQIDLRLRPYFQ
jgi:molybdopterin-guanine dinucleotide biosynthesis protein B